MSLTICRFFGILSTYWRGYQSDAPTTHGGKAPGGRVPSHQRGPHSQPWRHSQRTQRLGHSLRQPDTGCNRLNLKGIFAIKLEAAPRYQLSNFYNKDLRVVNLATLILRLTSDAQSQPRNVRRCYSGSRSSPASLRGWNLPASFC